MSFTNQFPLKAASFSLLPAQTQRLGWLCSLSTCCFTSVATFSKKLSDAGYMLQANVMSCQIKIPNLSHSWKIIHKPWIIYIHNKSIKLEIWKWFFELVTHELIHSYILLALVTTIKGTRPNVFFIVIHIETLKHYILKAIE